jgi:hypothetical protein
MGHVKKKSKEQRGPLPLQATGHMAAGGWWVGVVFNFKRLLTKRVVGRGAHGRGPPSAFERPEGIQMLLSTRYTAAPGQVGANGKWQTST